MKISRLIGIMLTVLLVAALALSITACKDDGKKNDPTPTPTPDEDKVITGVSFESTEVVYDGNEHKLEITGTLPEGVSVSYEGNVGTDAGTYNATATLSGEGYKTVTMNARLTIEKADITTVSFEDKTVTYNGEVHELTASGIPEGAEAVYTDNAATDAGTYTAKLTVTHKNYNTYTATAALIVNKAPITGITLESATFVYDGEAKSIAYEGELPEGVEPEWTGNGVTEVGDHAVILKLSGKNYETLELSAFIIIEAAPVVSDKIIEGVKLLGGEFTYDGTEKSLEVSGDVPDGVTVTYAGNSKINAGTYSVTAVLTGEGYQTLTLTAELKINKAVIKGVTLEDGSFTYDADVYHSLRISGTLPEGTKVEYSGNGVNEAGTYKVTAIITGDNYETLILEATLIVTGGSGGGGILTPAMPF